MSRQTLHPQRRLKATQVGYRVREMTQVGPVVAQVQGVYQRACNLEMPGGRLITLLAPARPGPANIVVPDLQGVLGRVADGQTVTVTSASLKVAEANLVIDLTGAPAWERVRPPDLPLPGRSVRHAAILAAMAIALERAESPGLIHLLPDLVGGTRAEPGPLPVEMGLDFSLQAGMLLQARSAILQLETLLTAGELEASLACAKSLIGLGLGLTPSGDDFLTGMILTLHYANWAPGSETRGIAAFGRGVVGLAMGRTTPVSLEQLRYASHGEAEEVIARAAIALLWALESLRPAIEALLDTGSSSGSDLLSGMCIASKLLFRPWNLSSAPARAGGSAVEGSSNRSALT
jgi:hypothetical protein